MRRFGRSAGFALPTVVIVGTVLFGAMVVVLSSTSSVRTTLDTQFYEALARDAAESGAEHAKACLNKNNLVAQWSSASQLRPSIACTGTATCTAAACYLVKNTQYAVTYSVGGMTTNSVGDQVISSTGAVSLLRASTGVTWKTYAKTFVVNISKIQSAPTVTPLTVASGAFSLSSNGDLIGWGCNTSGQLGNGTTTNNFTPSLLASIPGTVDMVVTGDASTNAAVHILKNDGSVWAWGYNAEGQVGNGTTSTQLTPVKIIDSGVVKLIVGNNFTSSPWYETVYAIKTDGSLWAWGHNTHGEVGNGATTNQLLPIQVIGSGVSKVVVGKDGHSVYAIKTDGSLWAWGQNTSGQVGNGTTTVQLLPVQVIASGVSQVVANWSVYAIKTDGSLWAWGSNLYGQVGNNSSTMQLSPVMVISSGVATLGNGYWQTAAIIKTDGSLWMWGQNAKGEVGNGTNVHTLAPVQIIASGVSKVFQYTDYTYALKTDGSLWGWGSNSSGVLGNGTTTVQLSPIQIFSGGILAVNDFPRGIVGAVVKSDGSVWTWGDNSSGLVGNGTTTNQLTPVQVIPSGAVSAGRGYGLGMFAYMADGSVQSWGSAGACAVPGQGAVNQLTPKQIQMPAVAGPSQTY